MAKFISNIPEAISNWNLNNPTLRRKTMKSVADEISISAQSLSQIDKNNSANQFQKHCAVIFESKQKAKQLEVFDLYKKLDVLVINKLVKICEVLECQIWDVIKKID